MQQHYKMGTTAKHISLLAVVFAVATFFLIWLKYEGFLADMQWIGIAYMLALIYVVVSLYKIYKNKNETVGEKNC